MDEFDEIEDEHDDDMQPVEGEDETPQQLYEHYRFVADRGQTLLRVDKFLVDRMTGATRNRIQMAADAGCIMANGRPVKSNYRVKPEDVVTIMMTRPPELSRSFLRIFLLKLYMKMRIFWLLTNRQALLYIRDTVIIPEHWLMLWLGI